MDNSNDLIQLLEALNDFTITLLSPFTDSPHFLTLWSKFKTLLHPDNYDPAQIQSFLSDLDSQYQTTAGELPMLSTKWLSDLSTDDFKNNMPVLQGTESSNTNSCELEKKSGNSTQSSNSPETPESMCSDKENRPREEVIRHNMANDIRSYRSKIEPKGHFDEEQSFSKEMPLTLEVKSTTNVTRLEYTRENSRAKTVDNEVDSGKGLQSCGEMLLDDLKTPKNKCPSAMEYISKALNHSFTAMATSSLYGKFSVWEPKTCDTSLYLSLALGYFMYLLSERSTSLALSTLYEKVVLKKIQLEHYENDEKLYESLSTGLKTVIKEKIAKPGQYKSMQQSFLNLFFGDCYFQEGLVALLKELLVEYIHELEKEKFDLLFGNTNKTIEELVEMARKSDSEPIEAFVSVYPNLIEGNIEIHYIRSNQIEIVLYNPLKNKTYRQPLFSLTCTTGEHNPRKSVYSLLLVKDDVDLIEKIEIKEVEKPKKEEMKGTMYFSLDSEEDQESKTNDKTDEKDNICEPKIDMEQLEKPQEKKSPKKVISFNRDHLFLKVKGITTVLDNHSHSLTSLIKPKSQSSTNKPSEPSAFDYKSQISLRKLTSRTPSNNFHIPNDLSQEPKFLLKLPELNTNNDYTSPSPSSDAHRYNFHSEADTTSPQIQQTKRNFAEYSSPASNNYSSGRMQQIRIPLTELAMKLRGTPQDDRTGRQGSSPTSALPFDFGRQREGFQQVTSAGKSGSMSNNNRNCEMKRAAVEYYGAPRQENMGVNRMASPLDRRELRHATTTWRDDEKENTNLYGLYVNKSFEKLPAGSFKKYLTSNNMSTEGNLLDDFLRRSPKNTSAATHF